MPELHTPLGRAVLPFVWAAVKGAQASGGLPGRVFWYLGCTLLAVSIIIGVIWAKHVWEGVHESEDPTSNEEMLDELRRAYAAGTMSEAEFRRVSELLSGQTPASHMPERAIPRQTQAPVPESTAPEGGQPSLGPKSEPAQG